MHRMRLMALSKELVWKPGYDSAGTWFTGQQCPQESVNKRETTGYNPRRASLVIHLPRSSENGLTLEVLGLYRRLSYVGGASTGHGQAEIGEKGPLLDVIGERFVERVRSGRIRENLLDGGGGGTHHWKLAGGAENETSKAGDVGAHDAGRWPSQRRDDVGRRS